MSDPHQPSHASYPVFPDLVPPARVRSGTYVAQYAVTADELDTVLRLRYEVFNIELKEGLQSSHETGRDKDQFDDSCHHLMVSQRDSGELVGTYRLQTHDMAKDFLGFYSETEFDLHTMSEAVLSQAIELGRACIHRDHRHGRVLFLLWRGLLEYIKHNRKRYLFGCCSLTSQDMKEGWQVYQYLHESGSVHPEYSVTPKAAHACPRPPDIVAADASSIPLLMRLYLENNAKVCSPPAIDRVFRTIDYLMVFDLEELPERTMKLLQNTH